jgi:hypothetical protein
MRLTHLLQHVVRCAQAGIVGAVQIAHVVAACVLSSKKDKRLACVCVCVCVCVSLCTCVYVSVRVPPEVSG